MGMNISGGMLVGFEADGIWFDDQDGDYSLCDWIEDNGLDCMSPWYDADTSDCIVGFTLPDTEIEALDEWVEIVKRKAEEFEKLTGIKATLYGTQNVY